MYFFLQEMYLLNHYAILNFNTILPCYKSYILVHTLPFLKALNHCLNLYANFVYYNGSKIYKIFDFYRLIILKIMVENMKSYFLAVEWIRI